MGNTNLPQAGAQNLDNGRDTRSGDEQLSDAEKRKRDTHDKPAPAAPAPSRPKNAPPRIPGQDVVAEPAGDPYADRPQGENPPLPADDPYDPHKAGDGRPSSRSHVPSGYSAPDAT